MSESSDKDTMSVGLSEKEAGVRILEMSYLLGEIAPVYSDKHRHACRAALGQDLAIVLPTLLSDIGRIGMKDTMAALPYVRFVYEAAGYILGRGPFPATQAEPANVARRRVRKTLKSMRLAELRPAE